MSAATVGLIPSPTLKTHLAAGVPVTLERTSRRLIIDKLHQFHTLLCLIDT
jgi:hypothetical protein